MNAKLERVHREIEKTRDKITILQGKMRELERERTELENLEIVGTVRGLNISLTDLETLLKNQSGVLKVESGVEKQPNSPHSTLQTNSNGGNN